MSWPEIMVKPSPLVDPGDLEMPAAPHRNLGTHRVAATSSSNTLRQHPSPPHFCYTFFFTILRALTRLDPLSTSQAAPAAVPRQHGQLGCLHDRHSAKPYVQVQGASCDTLTLHSYSRYHTHHHPRRRRHIPSPRTPIANTFAVEDTHSRRGQQEAHRQRRQGR